MNAFVLMVIGLWSFIGVETPSPIALIPVFTGALLLSFIKGLRYGSLPMTRLSMILTVLILIAMFIPFIDSMEHGDSATSYRIGFMIVSCAVTIGFFVSRFIKVKKRRMKIKS